MVVDQYRVKFKSDGFGGWADYDEEAFTLAFPWERTTLGFTIEIPLSKEWNDFCDLNHALAAKNRRGTILNRIGKAAAREYWGGIYSIGEREIDVHRPSVLRILQRWRKSAK
jgi:hypothetical protein